MVAASCAPSAEWMSDRPFFILGLKLSLSSSPVKIPSSDDLVVDVLLLSPKATLDTWGELEADFSLTPSKAELLTGE